MDLREERELAFQRLLKICQSGLVSVTDFRWGLVLACTCFCRPARSQKYTFLLNEPWCTGELRSHALHALAQA